MMWRHEYFEGGFFYVFFGINVSSFRSTAIIFVYIAEAYIRFRKASVGPSDSKQELVDTGHSKEKVEVPLLSAHILYMTLLTFLSLKVVLPHIYFVHPGVLPGLKLG